MMKCLAPLLLVASTVAPHAENCPVFPTREDYVCKTRVPEGKPPFRLKLQKVGSAYRVTKDQLAVDLIPGTTSEQSVEGQTIQTTVTCDTIESMRTREILPALLIKKQIKGGKVLEGTYFYTQGAGLVRQQYALKPNGFPGLKELNSCSQYVESSAPPQSTTRPAPPQ